MPATLTDWLAHWQRVHPQPIAMGLERVSAVAERLGVSRPAPCVITIAGTNGKGSTVAFLDAMLRAGDRVVGSYTSPHLLRYNERIRVDGDPVEDREIESAFRRIEQARGDLPLTYFEAGTLAALAVFQAREVDVAVLEVGLGGRLDAVNLVDADAVVITTIDLDHQEWLGPDRERIGAEKAGVMRAGAPAVIGEDDPPASVLAAAGALSVALHRAGVDFFTEQHADGWSWRHADGTLHVLPSPALEGPVQRRNAAAAVAVLHALRGKLDVSAAALGAGIGSARLAGRLQRVSTRPEIVVDVGHNPQAARELSRWLSARADRRTVAVFSALGDKDIPGIVEPLLATVSKWFVFGLDQQSPRGLDAAAVAGRLGAPRIDAVVCVGIDDALARAASEVGPEGRVLVFGSFYTVAAALRSLRVQVT